MIGFVLTICAYILLALSHKLPASTLQPILDALRDMGMVTTTMPALCNFLGLLGFLTAAIGLRSPRHRVRKIIAMLISLPFVYGIIAGALA